MITQWKANRDYIMPLEKDSRLSELLDYYMKLLDKSDSSWGAMFNTKYNKRRLAVMDKVVKHIKWLILKREPMMSKWNFSISRENIMYIHYSLKD